MVSSLRVTTAWGEMACGSTHVLNIYHCRACRLKAGHPDASCMQPGLSQQQMQSVIPFLRRPPSQPHRPCGPPTWREVISFWFVRAIAEHSREQKDDFDLLIEMVPDQAEYIICQHPADGCASHLTIRILRTYVSKVYKCRVRFTYDSMASSVELYCIEYGYICTNIRSPYTHDFHEQGSLPN